MHNDNTMEAIMADETTWNYQYPVYLPDYFVLSEICHVFSRPQSDTHTDKQDCLWLWGLYAEHKTPKIQYPNIHVSQIISTDFFLIFFIIMFLLNIHIPIIL